jgi:hypothetical protein|tara:strand:- start:1222 stop:1509 length:288 start_codon:yes stop_codon:yes gene_type:complete
LTVYVHKDAKLVLDSNKATIYINGKLSFRGSGYPGILQFVKYCNDLNVTNQFKAQLEMREKPRFKQNENKEEEQDTLSPKKNKTKKKQWDDRLIK